MSHQPTPMCKAAVLCSWQSRDARTHQWTIAGMYDFIIENNYPSRSQPILWYAKLVDVRGDYEVEPRLLDPLGQVVAVMPIAFIRGSAPMYGAEFGGAFEHVIFRFPGKYTIQVLCAPIKAQHFDIMGFDAFLADPPSKGDLDVVVNCEFEVGPESVFAAGQRSQIEPK